MVEMEPCQHFPAHISFTKDSDARKKGWLAHWVQVSTLWPENKAPWMNITQRLYMLGKASFFKGKLKCCFQKKGEWILGRQKQQMSIAAGLFGISLMSQKTRNYARIQASHTQTHNSVSVPRESPSHLIDFIPLWFFSCFFKKKKCFPVSNLIPSAQFEYSQLSTQSYPTPVIE